jgi:hypothetical protein
MALTPEQQALDYNPELQDVSRQRKLAELLMAQGMQQPQGQMISGYYVAPSFTQQLNPMANILAGQAIGERADTKQTQMAEILRVKGDAAAKDVMDTYKQDPQAALAKASQYQQFPQVKALLPQLSKVALPEATTLEREFAAAKSDLNNPFKGSLNDFKNQMSEYQKLQAINDKARLGLEGQRVGLEGARLGLEKEKLAAELGGAKLNDSQGQAVGFGTRAKEASAILEKLESEGVKDIGKTRAGIGAVVGMTPLIGEKLEQNVISGANVLPSFLGGPNEAQQATLQARKNFATAVLRKESGATIQPSEFADVTRIYFPEPGDDANIVRQKQRARDLAIKSLEVQAGPGARFIKEFQPQTDFGNDNGGWRIK